MNQCKDCKHKFEGDRRCCPKCHSPHWQGSRELTNYPAQEGVRGVGGTVRNFESMERVNRNRD